MGGNAAENHPVRLQVGHRGRSGRERQARRRSIRGSRARPRSPMSTRRSAPGTDIAFLLGLIRYAHREQAYPRGLRQDPHQRPLHRQRGVRASRTGCSRASTRRRASTTRPTWDYELDEKARRQGRPDAAAPALRLPAPEEARRRATRPRWSSGSAARPKDEVPQGRRDRHLDRQRRARRHDHVRAGLDAALDRRADDPRRGDAAAPARQHRPAGRRRERASAATPTSRARPTRPARSRSCPATSRRRPGRRQTLAEVQRDARRPR